MAAGKESTAKKKGTAKKKTSSPGAKKSSGQKRQNGKKSSVNYTDEVLFLLTTAISVILLFSNLHLCGSLGDFLFFFQRGAMGILGLTFPFFFFGVMLFFISNRENTRAMLKLAGVIGAFWILCGIFQLFCETVPDKRWDMSVYYEAGRQSISGGVLGGIWNALLRPVLGFWGMVVVLLIGEILLLVLITGRSLFQPFKQRSSRIYSAAKEDMSRKKESYDEYRAEVRERKAQEKEERRALEKEERETKKRMDQKRNGMLKDPLLKNEEEFGEPDETLAAEIAALEIPIEGQTAKPETEMETDPIREAEVTADTNEPEPFTVQQLNPNLTEVHMPGFEQESAVKEDWVAGLSGEIDQIFAQKDSRTLDELEAVEYPVSTEAKTVFDFTETKNSRPEPESFDSGVPIVSETIFSDEEEISRYTYKKEYKESEQQTGTKTGTAVYGAVTKEGENILKPQSESFSPQIPRREYQIPPVSLLKMPKNQGRQNRDYELKETAVKLQQTLRSFGVGVNVTNISCGPAVTRYEVTPEQGVKVSRIAALADDIKLNLAAADIRIEAPIPGKSAVGIEVPNKETVTVSFRELIESEEFRKHPSKLAFAVGKDLSGQIIVSNLASMPHLLIAGATGSGKSVCINTLIMSVLYKATPEEVRLIMVDPKVVELSIYNGIPHLLIPVVTDPKKAAAALNWAVAEMTDRYNKFAEYTVRDLKSYNERIEQLGTDADGEPLKPLPQIIIIVDELADLMMVAHNEVEDAICRLAQLARAAGIHLVLATQRPSVNVITGLIKANMPSRIAFAVSSGVDSRTILDMNGAEKLLGKGDMLFAPSGYPKPVRLQGAFVSDQEVSDVVSYISENTDVSAYQNEVDLNISAGSAFSESKDSENGGEQDVYFAQAGRFLIEKEKASSGMLQRAFKIGFNRASRIMEQLYQAGVVGEDEGTKPRKILMTLQEFESYLEENHLQ